MTDETMIDRSEEEAAGGANQMQPNLTVTNSTDDIRRQVQERVVREAAQAAAATGAGSTPAGNGKPEITSKFIRDCLGANELGDAMMYAHLFRDKFVFCKNSEEWYEWNGVHWQRDVMGRSLVGVEEVVAHYLAEYSRVSAEIKEMLAAGATDTSIISQKQNLQDALLRRASQLRGDRRRNNCLKFVHTIERPLAITGDEFDAKPMLFPVANGVIDLETGKLLEGRPSDYLTKASPVMWQGIDTPCPLWEKTLLEIFGNFDNNEEIVSYLRRLFGYSITGLIIEKVFPVLYGKTGWNGRSLIMETIRKVMGDFCGSIPAEMLLSQRFGASATGPRPDIMGLKGIRLAFASEIDEEQRFSTGRIKNLTGKDQLVGRNPHDVHLTRFYPTHKLFLMTNTKPDASAKDKAFWYRMHLIPFEISFVNRDPVESFERRAIMDLDKQIEATELPGILAWLVRGCLEWQQDGLNPPANIKEATEKYRRGQDLIADFLEECTENEEMASEGSSQLFARFTAWYIENIGKKVPSGTWFGKQMGERYNKVRINGRSVYQGILLKPTEEE
jgi:putative DNA primase/helicase